MYCLMFLELQTHLKLAGVLELEPWSVKPCNDIFNTFSLPFRRSLSTYKVTLFPCPSNTTPFGSLYRSGFCSLSILISRSNRPTTLSRSSLVQFAGFFLASWFIKSDKSDSPLRFGLKLFFEVKVKCKKDQRNPYRRKGIQDKSQ